MFDDMIFGGWLEKRVVDNTKGTREVNDCRVKENG